MADREVEVSVNAEGVDEAAGEMGGDAAGVGGPDGGGGGGRGRLGGKLITRLVGLLAVLGPILDVLGVVSQVLEAFVAPVAVLLMRLLQPALRLLIRVLPVWFDLFAAIMGVIDFLAQLRGALVSAIMSGVSRVGTWLQNLPSRIWSFMKRLPSLIGSVVAENIPDFPDFGGGLGGGGDGLLSRLPGLGDDGDGGSDGGDGPLVQIGGGLQPFVDRITQDGSFDFP